MQIMFTILTSIIKLTEKQTDFHQVEFCKIFSLGGKSSLFGYYNKFSFENKIGFFL